MYGWIQNVLVANEYRHIKFDKGNSVTEVIRRPVAVDTYDRYGQIKPQPDSLIDIKV